MSSSYTSALQAAREAAADQHYPPGTLYVVATPIGNLADITLRALHVLGLVESIACEDTRHTQSLLRAYGIDKAGGQLVALHQHNEAQAAQTVIDLLRQGQRVAYVSDAGTPGVSDPGARLVAAAGPAGGAASRRQQRDSSVVRLRCCRPHQHGQRLCFYGVFAEQSR